jgi:uncharacterized protein YbaR (Trm112 family)
MPIQEKFLDLLVCPVCYGKLIYKKYELEGEEAQASKNKKWREELWCRFDKLAYLIKQDIPIMLVEDARTLSLEELDQCR